MTTSPQQGKTVLLTLGRLPVALDLARSFHAAGWRVVVAEPFRMHLCRMSRAVDRSVVVPAPAGGADAYLDALADVVRAEGVCLVVPVSEEAMYAAALRARVPPGVIVYGVPQGRLLRLHDKLAFNRLAGSLDLPVPRTAAVDDPAARTLCAAHDYVLKPRHSCSGRGVSHHARGEEPGAGESASMLVQQRLEGEALSSFAVARGGAVLGGTVYRPVVTDGSVAVVFERVRDAPAVEEWVERFVRGTAHEGFVAFDFIVGEDGVARAIECNPRATSGIHFLDTEQLAPVITGAADALGCHDHTLLAESWSAFTVLLGRLFRPAEFGRVRRALSAARDISWSGSDPWPFALMMINSWPLIARAMASRQTFAEVAALDIEWRGAPGDSP